MTVTRGAVASVEPVTATLPVVPANVHSGVPPFCGATVGQAPTFAAVAGAEGRVYKSEIDAVLDDEDDVFVGEPHAVTVRSEAAQAANARVGDTRERFTAATVQKSP